MGVTERQLDKLYGTAPADFIAARDALAAELKKAGDKDGAAEVKALRKPTVVAWAANQAARKDKAGVTELLKAGDSLARAQQKMLEGTGRPADLKKASERRRKAVEALVAKAARTIGPKVSDAQRESLAHTFEAASVDDEAADLLSLGRLTTELEQAAGLGEAIGFAAADEDDEAAASTPGSGSRRSDRRAARAARRGDGEDRRSSDRSTSEAQQATHARAEAKRRAKAADEATEQARRAAAEMQRAREAVERAEQQLDEARARYEKSQAKAKQAQAVAARAVEDARDAVSGLGAMLDATRPD